MSDSLCPADPSIAPLRDGEFWVFAYGSLMWNPGFAHEERVPALLRGGHRALCIRSMHYRGTPEVPGLVLGLDRGGSCRGVAFRVPRPEVEATYAYLTEREMVTRVYTEQWRRLRLDDGREVRALTYFADPHHPQYIRLTSREEIVAYVLRAQGIKGPCRDYVIATLEAMAQIGIRDHSLDWLSEALAAAAAASA